MASPYVFTVNRKQLFQLMQRDRLHGRYICIIMDAHTLISVLNVVYTLIILSGLMSCQSYSYLKIVSVIPSKFTV